MVNQHVLPLDGKWAVRAEGNQHPSRVVATQAEAIEVAKRIADTHGVAVVIHDVDGKPMTTKAQSERSTPRWLALAEDIKARVPGTPSHLRPKHPDASVERVRELAGIISLDGPISSTDIFDG